VSLSVPSSAIGKMRVPRSLASAAQRADTFLDDWTDVIRQTTCQIANDVPLHGGHLSAACRF